VGVLFSALHFACSLLLPESLLLQESRLIERNTLPSRRNETNSFELSPEIELSEAYLAATPEY
jgi:hypothetical protein